MILENSTVKFNDNTAVKGGAIYLLPNSSIIFDHNIVATFMNNKATDKSGAIHFNYDLLSKVILL